MEFKGLISRAGLEFSLEGASLFGTSLLAQNRDLKKLLLIYCLGF